MKQRSKNVSMLDMKKVPGNQDTHLNNHILA